MTTIYGKDRRGGSSFREDVPCKLMAQICWCWFRQKELWKVIVKRLTQAIYGSSPSVVGASKWHTARLLEARLCVHKKALMLPTANHQRKGLLMQRRWCRRRRKRERIDGPIVAPLPRRYSIEFAIAGTTSVEPRPKWLNFAGAIAECTLRSRLRRYLSILCITRSKLKPKKGKNTESLSKNSRIIPIIYSPLSDWGDAQRRAAERKLRDEPNYTRHKKNNIKNLFFKTAHAARKRSQLSITLGYGRVTYLDNNDETWGTFQNYNEDRYFTISLLAFSRFGESGYFFLERQSRRNVC